MNNKKTQLLFLLFFLTLSFAVLGQRFNEEISVRETFFSSDGKTIYIFSEKDKVYRWNIHEARLEKEWDIANRFSKMYFVGEDVYLLAEVITENYDAKKTLYQYNRNTDNFDVYYKVIDAYYDDNDKYVYETLESIGTDGSIVTFLHAGSAHNTASTFGSLFLRNPATDSKEEIIKMTESGAVFPEPFYQPTYNQKLICMDFNKFDYGKKKVSLYDVGSGKHAVIRKKVKYNNSVLHGFNDFFVFEYYALKKKKSEYTFYDSNGEQIEFFDFGKYCGILFDYMTNEIYLRHEDGTYIDVYSVDKQKFMRTVPCFADFFLRSESREPIPAIQNGKNFRYVNESVYMSELIGYIEQFDFKTGTYMRVGQPLREGYSFEDRDKLFVTAMAKKEKSNEAAKAQAAENFKATLTNLPQASTSGNTMSLRKQGTTIHNDVYRLVSVGCYGQLAEHAIKLAECDSRVVMLIQSDETTSDIKGDYKIDIVTKNYYVSVVNSNAQHEKVTLIGQDVHETHTNKHTMKVEKTGWHASPTNFTWSIGEDNISISSPKGSFSFDKNTCQAK